MATVEQLQNAVDAWILVERNYEYNDENYYTTDGYAALGVYLDQAEAQAEADKQNKEWIADQNADEWIADQNADEWDGDIPRALYQVHPVKVR
jgi:hypothetical protein